jgi:COP9 signalosome complex subunit 12
VQREVHFSGSLINMQAALEPFRKAHAERNAHKVAELLSPVAPRDDPARLYHFHRAANEQMVESDVRHALKYNKHHKIPNAEVSPWTDIFVSYWRAVGQILLVEELRNQGRLGDRQLVDLYEAWKELASNIVNHIQDALPPWAVISMYETANHLRAFAINADKQLAAQESSNARASSFQESAVQETPQHPKLEEAARLFNRMFAACLGDRCASIVYVLLHVY